MTCDQCEHAAAVQDVPTYPLTLWWICGHYDVMDLDSNNGGRDVGFVAVAPEWCPLKPPQPRQQELTL